MKNDNCPLAGYHPAGMLEPKKGQQARKPLCRFYNVTKCKRKFRCFVNSLPRRGSFQDAGKNTGASTGTVLTGNSNALSSVFCRRSHGGPSHSTRSILKKHVLGGNTTLSRSSPESMPTKYSTEHPGVAPASGVSTLPGKPPSDWK